MAYAQYLLGQFAARAVLFEELLDEDPEIIAVARIQHRNGIYPMPPPTRVEDYISTRALLHDGEILTPSRSVYR